MHLKEEYAFITILFFGAFLGFSDGSCVLPWAGVWYDSAFPDNDVTFDNSSQSVLGWKIQAYSTEGTNWVCLEESQVDNKLLFRSLTNFGIFSIPIFMFRCIRWTKISDDAYLYYVLADEQTNIANQRLYAEASDTNLTIETACSATNPPETNEFHVIVRKGRESSARQNCPSLLLHNFTYIHDNGTMTSCDPANGSADGCSNRQQIEFDFSQCNTAVGFSAGGVYYCLHSETVGPVQYALTITPESVDYQKTFKFTCFVLQQSGSYIYASDTKGSCKRTQSPFSKETDGTGFLKLLSFDSCPFSQPGGESGSDGVIIAAVAVSAVILLIILIVIVIYCYKKSRKRKLASLLQTDTSKKMGDRQPLNESIDNEDATSNDVTPETCSTERTSSTAKRTDAKKSQKEKRKSEMEQQTSKIVKDSPYNEKQTCEKKKDSNLEIILEEDDYKQMNNVKTNDTGTLCLDDDRIIIDADKFLETSKYDTKQRSKGKVIFLEDNEHFRDQNMESYKVDEDVKTADQSQNVNVKSIYSTRIERSLQILNEKEADKPENEQNKDGVFDSAQMSRVKKETRETDTISQNEAVVTKDNDVESSYPSKDIQERDTVETDTDRICKASGHHKDQKVRNENEVETNKTLALAKNKTNLKKSISEKHKKKELHVNVKSFNDEKIDNNKEGKIKENIKSEKIAVINTGQSGEADNLIVVPQLPTDGIKCMDQETPENHSSLELLRSGEQEQFLDKRLSTPAVEPTFDQEQDVHTEKQKRTGKKKKHELKDDPDKSIMVKTEDSTTHKKKKTGKVKIGKSKGKSKGRKELSKIKGQESSSVDPNKGIKMNEVPYVNGLFNNENERRSEDLQEINSVNENQLTAVQAWASVDMETDNTHKFNDRDSNLTYDEDKETDLDTYGGNEDEDLNKMDSEELLELRPLSSLAPLSTLMREETSSSFIYHNYKTVQKSAEFEIYHNLDSSALKTTGLKGSEDSSSLTKVDESLSSLRILDIEQ